MRILVVGAGAVGGAVGARLTAAGRDVTLLVRPARAQALTRGGLRLSTPAGTTTTAVRTVTAGALDGPYDVVLLAVKAYALEEAMDDVGPAVGPRTVVIPLLNGIRHVPALTSVLGHDRVWGGVAMIHATLDDDGGVTQLTDLHRMLFGPLDGGADPRLDAVAAALGGAGFDARPSADIVQDLWEKWILLAGLGAVTTLMHADVGTVVRAPGGLQFAAGVAAETISVATAAGHRPRRPAVATLRTTLTTDAPTTSSLYRDMVSGRPMEGDAIVGDFVAQGEQHGVNTPLLSAAYAALAVEMERRGWALS